SSVGQLSNAMRGKHWLKTRSGHVAVAALAWTILGCVFALPDLSVGANARHALLLSLTLWWSWGILAPLIVRIDRRIPVSSRQPVRRILAHFLPCLLVTAAYVYVLEALRAASGIGQWNGLGSIGLLVNSLRGMFLWNWLVYWLILGVWQAY